MIAIRSILLGLLGLLGVLTAPGGGAVVWAASDAAAVRDLQVMSRHADFPAPAADGLLLAQADGPVRVPSLNCLTIDNAQRLLANEGLQLGNIHRRDSSSCPDGGIVAQSPPRGTIVNPGTAIEVIVTGDFTPPSLQPSQPSDVNPIVPPRDGGGTIPDLAGRTPAEAQQILRNLGMDIGTINRESASAPLGTIIAQSPRAGNQVVPGARINITVAAEVRVPDLRQLDRAGATERLGTVSLRLGRVTEENSSQPPGTVIKQWPLPGVPAASGDAVDITLARGQTVPDLRQLGLGDARVRLREAGLKPGRVDSRVSGERRGTIIDQNPAPGADVDPGATVDVVLAATPIVPNLQGRTLDEAKELLQAQRLRPGTVTRKVSAERQGTIIEQEPRAGIEATPGTPVAVVLAESLEIPNLIGQTLAEAGAQLATQLLRLGKVERRATGDPAGTIIEQTPAPGSSASLGVGIDVVVATAPSVPDLQGMSRAEAEARLAEQLLSVGDVALRVAPDVPEQTVIGQSPPAGTPAASGQAVALTLSVPGPSPARPDLVAVPTLVDLNAALASRAAEDAGLTLRIEGEAEDGRPARITSQSPEPGTLIKQGEIITASIAVVDEFTVPDLTGLDRAAAETRLAGAFLALGDQTWQLSGQPSGTVLNQDPLPGTPVSFGDRVSIVLSADSLVPDLTGLTPDEAFPVLGGQSLQLGEVRQVFSLRWPGTIVGQNPAPQSPLAQGDQSVDVEVVGLVGPMAIGGSLLLLVIGVIWFRPRHAEQHAAPPPIAMQRPPVYGLSKAAPPVAQDHTEIVVEVDPGTQVIQTDAASLVRTAIRVRGKVDPGEQKLAIDA